MNDFLNKLGAAARKTADSVSTNVNVAGEEQKIRAAYQALGKLYYKAVRDGAEPSGPDFADQCRKIEASLRRIRELRDLQNVTPDTYAGDEDFELVE